METRSERVVIKLTPHELHLLQAVSDPDLPRATAARRLLLDKAQWLYENGRTQRQRRPIDTQHVAINPTEAHTPGDTHYDFSDSQDR